MGNRTNILLFSRQEGPAFKCLPPVDPQIKFTTPS